MNNELIKRLKDKNYVRAFGLMSPEEQACFREVGEDSCLYYSSGIPDWQIPAGFANGTTYAIKPDYQPEPEFVDLEIEVQPSNIGKYVYDRLGCTLYPETRDDFVTIDCLPSLPNFKEFWYYREFGHRVDFCCYGKVAPLRDRGETVFARLRK